MILILTDKYDSHANYLIKKLTKEKLPFYRFNLDVISLKSTKITFWKNGWKISQRKKYLDITVVKCIWHRRTFVELLLDESSNSTTDFKIWKNEWNKTLIGLYNELKDKPWLNYWRNSYRAENKFLQIELAKKYKFNLPETIVSNDKDELLEFALKHNDVALKFMDQDFYKNDSSKYLGLYVNKITSKHLVRFKKNSENPIVLQEYIEKNFEVRYTVVGSNHFVCKIDSQKSKMTEVDWRRYDIPRTPHAAIQPPEEIESRVRQLMKELKIEYGALDFIVNKKNEWFFLEVNSMGQFLWIEDLTGLKISHAIIEWMKKCLF